MSVEKRINYDVQGGVKNYLGKQPVVNAPKYWQSSPDHPTTELAYITPAEKDLLVKQDLHGSLKGGVNRGPSGIMSLNGWGSADEGQNVSGATASAAESGTSTSDTLAAGMSNQDVKDFQSAAINAGAGQTVNPGFFDSKYTVSPDVLEEAKKYRQDPNNLYANQAFKKTQGGTLGNFISGGGILGNIVKGIGQKFGLGKKYNEPTYDMSQFNEYGLGGSQTPTYYNDLGNELMLSTQATPSTLDLSKLETGDLNNLASLIKASEQSKAIAPNFMYMSPQFQEGLDNSMYGGDRMLFGSDENQKYYTGDVIPTFGEVYESEADGITNYDFDQQPNEGIMGIDVGQDDLMAKLSSAETREKTILQTGKDLGMNTPEQNEKLEQLKQKEKEAALNATAIV